MKPAAGKGRGHPPLGELEERIIRILRDGPHTTRSISEKIAMEENHLSSRKQLLVQPYWVILGKTRRKVLGALHRLEAKNRLVRRDVNAGFSSEVNLQTLLWRLATVKEQKSGVIDKGYSKRIRGKVWEQVQGSLQSLERSHMIMKQEVQSGL
ncbi:MAG: hypothetical protein ACREAY_08680 [Nitrososphaera sp.]|uniref:hypothetical protein n=1 Tax=Nitrososphaera sp. TaxID=1971748 RepID=UPI003D6F1837